MRDKSCLGVSHEFGKKGIPDYQPTSLKQALEQMKNHCLGKTNTIQIVGLHFRLDYLSVREREEFDKFCMKVCNNTLKRWNKVRKK